MIFFRIQSGNQPPTAGAGRLARFGVGVLAALAVVASLFIGAVFIVIILSLVAVGAAVFAVRLWWFKRQMEKAMQVDREAAEPSPYAERDSADTNVIDVEYTEVRHDQADK